MLVPLRLAPSGAFLALPEEPLLPTAPAPAPLRAPPSLRPSMAAASMSSSLGYSCSSVSYLRELGRRTSAAT